MNTSAKQFPERQHEAENLCAGHRMRLREKFLQHKISDCEVLELLLSYAIPRIDVKPIAKRLGQKFGALHNILTAQAHDLMSVPGVGINTAIFIGAIYEIMIQDHKHYMREAPVLQDKKMLEKYCLAVCGGKRIEEFHVLYLDGSKRLMTDDLHSSGTTDWAAVYPREIVRRALDVNAPYVLLLHNHPDGQSCFSTDDIEITATVCEMLRVVGIEVVDHLLVSGPVVYSARDLRLIN